MKVEIQFNDYTDLVNKVTNQASFELASKIGAQGKGSCPVDEGRLRNSIMWKTADKEGGFNDQSGDLASEKINVVPKEYEAYVGTRVRYAPYVEFGTRQMAPQPYLRPAILLYVRNVGRAEVVKMIQAEFAMGKLVTGQKRVFD
jgi:hypothetical protein